MDRLVRLTDAQWRRLEPSLPRATQTGGRNAKPHRPMVEAMIWILRTGAPWRDLPHAYGPWHSVYTRFSRWSQSGVLAALFEALARERDGEGYLIDATIVRAHQDASGGAKKGGPRTSLVGRDSNDLTEPVAHQTATPLNKAFTWGSVHEDPRGGRCARQPCEARTHARPDA